MDPIVLDLFRTIWSAILTAFGGLVFWNLRRLTKEIDKKADREDVAARHDENRATLTRIESAVLRDSASGEASRLRLQRDVQSLVANVARLEGRLNARFASRRPRSDDQKGDA